MPTTRSTAVAHTWRTIAHRAPQKVIDRKLLPKNVLPARYPFKNQRDRREAKCFFFLHRSWFGTHQRGCEIAPTAVCFCQDPPSQHGRAPDLLLRELSKTNCTEPVVVRTRPAENVVCRECRLSASPGSSHPRHATTRWNQNDTRNEYRAEQEERRHAWKASTSTNHARANT